MKKLHPTAQYKTDYKRFRNNPKKLAKLMAVLNMLQSEITIPAEYDPHMLTAIMPATWSVTSRETFF